MKVKNIALIVALVVVVILVLSLVYRLVTGLIGGLFNLVLCVLVVAGLIFLVFWMFAYAKRRKK